MKTLRVLAILTFVLAISAVAWADAGAVMAKVDEAAAAEGAAAQAAYTEAAALLAKDAEGLEPVTAEFASLCGRALTEVARRAGSDRPPLATQAAAVSSCVKDFYGAVIPAGKGDFTAVSAYLKTRAASAPAAQQRLAAAAALASDAAAGKADKADAFRRARFELFAAAQLSDAAKAAEGEQFRQARPHVAIAIAYLRAEIAIAEQAGAAEKAMALRDFAGSLAVVADDLSMGVDPGMPLADMIEDVESAVMMAQTPPAAAPATTQSQ